jgi:GGDEF domain-containing protein
MSTGEESRRLLVLSQADTLLDNLLSNQALDIWEKVLADSSAAAALLLQSNACDLLLVDESNYGQEGLEGLSWLARNCTLPIIFLADVPSVVVTRAYQCGTSVWLPRQQTLEQPALLTQALERSLFWSNLRRRERRTAQALDQCQRQIDRLVCLLWQTGPLDVTRGWYTHRHMLERLGEEVARASRHGNALTVALGEVQTPATFDSCIQPAELVEWTADQVTRGKRRSDVAGQYGLHGFMLLMTHTPIAGGLHCCRRLQRQLEAGVHQDPLRGPVRVYFGLSGFSCDSATPQRLLRCAEDNLEAAKLGLHERVVAELTSA